MEKERVRRWIDGRQRENLRIAPLLSGVRINFNVVEMKSGPGKNFIQSTKRKPRCFFRCCASRCGRRIWEFAVCGQVFQLASSRQTKQGGKSTKGVVTDASGGDSGVARKRLAKRRRRLIALCGVTLSKEGLHNART